MSERSFRALPAPLRGRWPADCSIEGSTRRPRAADRIEWVLEQYRTRHTGWTVKAHLCVHHGFAWSYTWTKTTLQRAGLVSKAPRRGAHRRRRPRKPCVGMMLHQDGSRHEWLAGQAACDLIVTMDDATSEIYSAFLVEEEGTAPEAGVHRQGDAQQPLHRPWQPLLPHPRGRRPRINTPRSAGSASSTSLPIRPRPAAAPSAPSAPSRTASSRNWRWRGSQRRPQTASSQTPTCPTTIGFATPPELEDSAFVPLEHPGQITTSLSPHRPHGRPRQHRALRKARPPDPRYPGQTPLRQGHGPGP